MFRFSRGYLFWIIFFLLTLILHSNYILDSDEGVVLEGAWNIINGRQIYEDFFAIVTPGSYYLVAGLWRLTGVSYWSANTLAVIALFLSAFGTYRVSRRLGGRWFYAPPLFLVLASWAWPLISYHVFSLATLIGALYHFCRGLDQGSRREMIYSGLLSAATLWFLQTKGGVLIFVFSTFLFFHFLLTKKKIYRQQAVYYLVFSLIPLIPWFIFWSPETLYQHLWVFPVFNYHDIINHSLNLWLAVLILWLMSVLFLIKNHNSPKVYLLLYLQLMLLLSALSLPDWFHIVLALVPLYILFPLIIDKIFELSFNFRWLFLALLLVLAIGLMEPSLERIWTVRPFRTVASQPLFMQIAVHCQQDRYLYAGAFIPGVYFESRRLNATSFSWLITRHHTPEQFQLAREALADKKPECAVLSPLFVGKYGYDSDNPVDNYIRANYRVIWSDANFQLFKMNSAL